MSASPAILVPRSERRKEAVVKILEEALTLARRGSFESVFLVAEIEGDPEALHWSWTGSDNLLALAAKLDLLKHQTYRRLFGDTPLAR